MCCEIHSVDEVRFADVVGRGFTPAVYAPHNVGLLIHRKRSPFPHKGRHIRDEVRLRRVNS